MPILPPEPNCFPAGLFAAEPGEATVGRAWTVLHTLPRQEKAVARQLLQSHVPFYLPLLSQRRLLRGRVLHSQVPLFAGYVFLLARHEERAAALPPRRVLRCLPVADQQGLWHDLRQIERLLDSGMPLVVDNRLFPGKTVEIRSGPLAGLRGTIVRAASGHRFVVRVDFIQRGAAVLMDSACLAAVEDVADVA